MIEVGDYVRWADEKRLVVGYVFWRGQQWAQLLNEQTGECRDHPWAYLERYGRKAA